MLNVARNDTTPIGFYRDPGEQCGVSSFETPLGQKLA